MHTHSLLLLLLRGLQASFGALHCRGLQASSGASHCILTGDQSTAVPLRRAPAAASVRRTPCKRKPHTTTQPDLKQWTPAHHSLLSAPGDTETEKLNPLTKAYSASFNCGRRSISRKITPGCQGSIYVTNCVCPLLVSISIFTTAHGHYTRKSCY